MKKISTLLFFTLCFLNSSFSANAQNFLWGRSGGSNGPTQGPDDETVRDMAVDNNGNVYVLTDVKSTGRYVANQSLSGYGGSDIVFASFKPDGSVRWAKVIGGAREEMGLALRTDGSNGVYIAGYIDASQSSVNIDADATIPQTEQRMLLVKYDINGVYQWYRLPQPDTVTYYSNSYTGPIDISVDANGNVYWLSQLSQGIYGGGGGAVVTNTADYLLKYDANGGFKGITSIDVLLDGTTAAFAKMTLDENNQKIYISGMRDGGNITMGGSNLVNTMYIGCFDYSGVFQWKRENSIAVGGFNGRPVIDNKGSIYLTGTAYGEYTGLPPHPADNFNGYTIMHGNGAGTPFVVKIDKNGNNIWAADAEVNATSFSNAIALLNNNEVIISGSFPGYLQWSGFGGTPYNKPPNDAYDVFIARFDANNGTILGMDKMNSSSGNNETPSAIVADGNNNVYIGGKFDADMSMALDNLANAGGRTDWFLVKYGNMWPDDVNSFVSDKDVVLYPNPAQNTVHIDRGEGTTMQLIDMTGRNLLTKQLKSDHASIEVSQYPSGNYIIQLSDKNGGRLTKKFVKS